MPHHCEATRRAIVLSLALGSQMRWLRSKTPGAAYSRKVPSGSWINAKVGSGMGPNMSEKIIAERATLAAKSAAFADDARGAKTETLTPSACFGLSGRFPATNVPCGAGFLHSK